MPLAMHGVEDGPVQAPSNHPAAQITDYNKAFKDDIRNCFAIKSCMDVVKISLAIAGIAFITSAIDSLSQNMRYQTQAISNSARLLRDVLREIMNEIAKCNCTNGP